MKPCKHHNLQDMPITQPKLWCQSFNFCLRLELMTTDTQAHAHTYIHTKHFVSSKTKVPKRYTYN